jgi:hypothetical protein
MGWMDWLRRRMTYANVMSTLAVFIALGGSSYAAVKISGSNIRNGSIAAKKLKRNSLTAREVRESRLGRVPRAATADRLGRYTADQLRSQCPSDTYFIADICVELKERGAADFGSAVLECLGAGQGERLNRRLPSYQELIAAMTLTTLTLAPEGELTSDVRPSTTNPGKVDVLVLASKGGEVAVVPGPFGGSRPYRCVTDPVSGGS